MKKLTQDTFSIYPSWVKSLVVTSNGELIGFACGTGCLYLYDGVMWEVRKKVLDKRSQYFTCGYDTTNWQNSAIDREVK